MDELNLFGGTMTAKQQEAVELHFEIKRNGEAAATALVEFAKGLKRMRDKRLYTELGFESFDDYAEKAVGIRQRQAYNYIQALEAFGETDLQSNAKLGITKLSILAALPAPERAEAMEQAEDLTTRQLKELAQKLAEKEEQLSLFKKQSDGKEAEVITLENEVARLRAELKAEREKPQTTVTRELTQAEIAEMTKDAVEKERKKQQKELKDAYSAIDKVRKEEQEKAAEQLKKALAEADKEKAAALERLEKMEGDAKISASPEVLKFSFYFEEAQNSIQKLREIIGEADEQTAPKLTAALDALLKQEVM